MANTQLAILLRVRGRRLSNLLASARGGAAAALGTLVLGAGAALLGGWLAVDRMVEAAVRDPNPGDVVSAGGAYGETGFWIAALLLMAFSFRLMEVLYRKQDVRLIAAYPVSLGTQFHYRLLSAMGELMVALLVVGLFFLPVVAVSRDERAVASLLLVIVSMASSLLLGFAIQLRAGVANFGGGDSQLGKVGRVDVGGGAPAAFSMSPAVAFVASLAVLLILKLAVLDEFFARGATRLFWFGISVAPVVMGVSYTVARRTFLRHYPHLLARFYEADLIVLDSGYAYHHSVTEGRRGLVERLIPASLLPHYRKDSLQFARRFPLVRLTHVVLWVGLAIVTAGHHLPVMWAALIPMVYLAVWAAPWARLSAAELEPGYLRDMPVAPVATDASKAVASLREAVLAVAPAMLVLAVFAWPADLGWAVVGITSSVVAVPALQNISRRSPLGGWLAGMFLAVATALAAHLVGLWAVAVPLLAGVVGLGPWFGRGTA